MKIITFFNFLNKRRRQAVITHRVQAFLLALLLLLVPLTACDSEKPGQDSTNVTLPSQSEIALPSPAAKNKPGSGRLRLWWQNPQNYNPLRPATTDQKGIYSLLYQTLFSYDDLGYLRSSFVESYKWTKDRLTLRIEVKKDLKFSDGSQLKPEDIVASINSWIAFKGWLTNDDVADDTLVTDESVDDATDSSLSSESTMVSTTDSLPDLTSEADQTANSDTSPSDIAESQLSSSEEVTESSTQDDQEVTSESSDRGVTEQTDSERQEEWANDDNIAIEDLVFLSQEQAMDTIAKIEAGDSYLEIRLSARCDNLLDYLIIPIVPAAYAQKTVFTFPPGSGSWYCAEQLVTGQLELKKVNGNRDLTLTVMSYESAQEAMQGFLQGEVDLLLLSATSWPRYGNISNLRTRKLPTGQFAWLQLNQDQEPFNNKDHTYALIKALMRSHLVSDRPAGSWLYSPVPDSGNHPYLPSSLEIKKKLEELSAAADLKIFQQEPMRPLLMSWPETDYADIAGEEIRRELRLQKVPIVREGESLMPEPTPDPSLTPTATVTMSPTPTPDPNIIFLPSVTPTPTPEPLDPSAPPETEVLKLVFSLADITEPYLFYNSISQDLNGENAAKSEELTILKEIYWQRLKFVDSDKIDADDANEENAYISKLTATMAQIELSEKYGLIGIASLCNVICYSYRIDGSVVRDRSNPYLVLEYLVIWP